MDTPPEISRNLFTDALDGAVATARQAGNDLGLLLVDLTNLSSINHYHGYEIGDQLLTRTYQELVGISKLPDTVFRVGSHRFAFMLPALENPSFIVLAVNRVKNVLDEALFVDQDMVGVDLKIGVAINSLAQRDALVTLAEAEDSLNHMKRGGVLKLERLVEEATTARRDIQLTRLFAEALHDNDFELYYQPKIHLPSDSVRSTEALIRWFPEGRDPVPPGVLVDLAEVSGRGYELAKWTIHAGVRQLCNWQQEFGIEVALNIQAGLVNHPDLCSLVEDALGVWSVEPSRLTLEITETAIIEDKESGFDNLHRLKQLGVRLSIDDFGTGYSSLVYFKQIPATELKIDRTFVARMGQDPQDLQLVEIMIQIAKQFGLAVVAEGIEDRESLRTLQELGCDYAQGYLFSKPLPRTEFENWVRNWTGLAAYLGE